MTQRQFHYGPVDCRYHFCVERRGLVDTCLNQLIGIPEEGGHYFTIWGSRQTGKTWLIRQVTQEIEQYHGEQMTAFHFSLGTLRDIQFEPKMSEDLPQRLSDVLDLMLPTHPQVHSWKDFYQLYSKEGGLWDRPLILLIDEVDTITH